MLHQFALAACVGLAAKRLYRTAQGFSPGLSSAKSALKVAAEARLQAVRVLFERRATNIGCHFQGTFADQLTQGFSQALALGCSV